MAEGKHTLWIEEIEGKFYLTTAKWPEVVRRQPDVAGRREPAHQQVGRQQAEPVAGERERHLRHRGGLPPQLPAVTLHLMYGPDPGPVPGRETSPELTAANKAKVDDALKKMGELMGATGNAADDHSHDGSGFAISTAYSPEAMKLDVIRVGTPGLWQAGVGATVPFDPATGGPPLPPPVSSLTKALMTASTPKMNLLGLTGPVPGSDGVDADVVAQKIVATPGFLDTIYARFKAEQQIRRATAPGFVDEATARALGEFNRNTALYSTRGFYGYMQAVQDTQPRSTWSDFLTDVTAFLTTIAQASEVFATTKDLPRTVVVQDELGMAGMGRLAKSSGFERSKPRNYAVRDFFAQEAMVARNLVNRAKTLQGVTPEKPEVVHGGSADDPNDPPRPLTAADNLSEWVAEAHSYADERNSPDAVTREDCIRAGTMGGNGEMGGQRE